MISIGVDVGGTAVKVCVADVDGGVVLEEFTISSGMNLTSTSVKQQSIILKQIRRHTEEKFSASFGIDLVVFAVSGGGKNSRKEKFRKMAMQIFNAKRLVILSDVEALRYLVLGDKTGIVVICGTGSIALSHSGKRIGGWGHLFGDEAGAYAIVTEIFKRFFDYIDGIGKHDLVYDELMKFYRVSSPYELTDIQLRKDFKTKIAIFAEYMPLTNMVKEVIDGQVDKFSKKVMRLAESESTDDVYFFGGMFKNEYFRDRMCKKLRNLNIHLVDIETHVELALNACYFSNLDQ